MIKINLEETVTSDGVNGTVDFLSGEGTKQVSVHADIVNAKYVDNNSSLKKAAIVGWIADLLDRNTQIEALNSSEELYEIDMVYDDDGYLTGSFEIHCARMAIKGNINLSGSDLKNIIEQNTEALLMMTASLKEIKTVSYGESTMTIKAFGGIEISLNASEMDQEFMNKAIQIVNSLSDPKTMNKVMRKIEIASEAVTE